MGPELLGVIITAASSAVIAGSWVGRRGGEQLKERLRNLNDKFETETEKLDDRIKELESISTRLPIEYVLKADYIRELQKMNIQFNQIQEKLDRLIQTILSSRKVDL